MFHSKVKAAQHPVAVKKHRLADEWEKP